MSIIIFSIPPDPARDSPTTNPTGYGSTCPRTKSRWSMFYTWRPNRLGGCYNPLLSFWENFCRRDRSNVFFHKRFSD
ncbi:MAG: hypothetical protein F6K36_06315 [Symploca sp. SIO3C6]|nr:hypothetical protein [Symploca sp. SIO3C6]